MNHNTKDAFIALRMMYSEDHVVHLHSRVNSIFCDIEGMENPSVQS